MANRTERLREVGRVTRVVVAILVTLGTGLIGLAAIFSDAGPGETLWQRALLVAGIYMAACAGIGVMFEKHWYLAVFTAWGPVILAAPVLLNILATGWSFRTGAFLFVLCIFPGFALACGFAGAWLRRHELVRHRSDS
jgi:hypothetical protein